MSLPVVTFESRHQHKDIDVVCPQYDEDIGLWKIFAGIYIERSDLFNKRCYVTTSLVVTIPKGYIGRIFGVVGDFTVTPEIIYGRSHLSIEMKLLDEHINSNGNLIDKGDLIGYLILEKIVKFEFNFVQKK